VSEPARLRVWGVGTSRTIRVHWMLCELGLPYETREIIPRTERMQDPEFLQRSPRGKVPILEDGELLIGESGAMVFHLADRYRNRAVLAPLPATPERALFDDLCLFALTELDAPLYVIRRHEGLPEIYGESPVAVAAARDYYLRGTEEIERRLADGRPYLQGDDFSGADLLVATCTRWASFVGIDPSEPIAAHGTRCESRPACREAMQRNFPPAALEALGRPPARAR
jgi:glutathione S-transferase